MVCLDIDRISEMMAISPFTGCNRWNWASFFDEDHFGNAALTLRERLDLERRLILPPCLRGGSSSLRIFVISATTSTQSRFFARIPSAKRGSRRRSEQY